jgi:hypothetical protein
MIEQQLAELKDILLAVHRKVANIEMQQRNPCSTCYYKQTHPKPAVPTSRNIPGVGGPLDSPRGCAGGCEPPQGWVKEIPTLISPETANKFQKESIPVQGESGPKFVIPVVDNPVTTKTNSLVERVFSRKSKGFTIETTGGQK